MAQNPCKPGLNPERGVSRAREAKRKGVPIDRSRGIVEGHSGRPRPRVQINSRRAIAHAGLYHADE